MSQTLKDLLATGADDAPAISAPSRQPLSFGALRSLIKDTLAQLNALGIGRNDRVAIVLPNGPEMATCFLACASGVTSAPLNPAYRADEFEFYGFGDDAGCVALFEELCDGLAAAVGKVEGPVVDVHADEFVGLGVIEVAAILKCVIEGLLAVH